MRSLVTGATGFLGSHLAHRLAGGGDDVRVLVRTTSDRRRLAGLELDVVEGDVTDAASVARAVDGVDRAFHCAAMVEFGPADPSRMEAVNVGGTTNVLTAAADAGVPVVHVSSVAALGPTPPDAPPRDETWWNQDELLAVYEVQKRRGHEVARRLAAEGASVRIAMPGGIYGLGDQSTMFDLITAYVRWPLPVGYLPDVRQSTVDVDDCADLLVRIAEDGVDGGEYIAAAEAVTVREWLTCIARGAGNRPPFLYVPTVVLRSLGGPGGLVAGWFGQSPAMVRETVAVATHDSAFSGERARHELGWSPRPLAQGMAELASAITSGATWP